MVKFGGISSKVIKAASVVAVLGTLAGCTPAGVESIRPEINNENAMVVLPELFMQYSSELAGDLGEGTGDGIGGPDAGTDNGIAGDGEGNNGVSGGTVVGDSANFDPLPYNVVASPDYIKYLDAQVYKTIKKIIEEVGGTGIYFRVFHSGYMTVADDTTAIQQSSIYDNKSIGTGTHVMGTVLPMFAYSWLANPTTNSSNSTTASNAQASTVTAINKSALTPSTTWVAASAAKPQLIDSKILKMWGNKRLEADTLEDYLRCMRSSVIGTVPNITLKVYLAGGRTSSVTLNNTSDLSGPRYIDHLSKVDTDRLFDSYNQYRNRQTVKHDYLFDDEYGLLFSYIDGYSKTIVFVGCFDGYTLESVFGDKLGELESVVNGVYDYTEWSQITAFVPDATILQAGVKGMN